MITRPKIVIVGGGFGGLYAAQALKKAAAKIVLIDRRNFHLFQPLLYQVATGGLSPANIAAPLRAVLKNQANLTVLMDEVIDFDLSARTVIAWQQTIAFDYLIVAAGARHHYFDRPDWEPFAPGLKSIEEATEIRARILRAFERAELNPKANERSALMTFVVVGAGPTGVELAGAVAEIAHNTLRGNFRRIDPSQSRILLLEAAPRVLMSFPPDLSAKAQASLERLGVEVRCNTRVLSIEAQQVIFISENQETTCKTYTVLWAAGVKASRLGLALANCGQAQLDRNGRVIVEADCSIKDFPFAYAIGDMTCYTHGLERPLPGVAPVAMQMGAHVAREIIQKLKQPQYRPRPFRYRDKGNMATIGRAAAVAMIGRWRFSGYSAWLAWLFVHLTYLIEFDNKLLVLWQWAWNYFTKNRSARLITKAGLEQEHEITNTKNQRDHLSGSLHTTP